MPPYREDPWQRIVNVGWGGGPCEIVGGGNLSGLSEEEPGTIFGPFVEGARLRFSPGTGPHDTREIFEANPGVVVLEFLTFGIIETPLPLRISRSLVHLRRLAGDGEVKTGEGIAEGHSVITLSFVRYQRFPMVVWRSEGSVWEVQAGGVAFDFRSFEFDAPQGASVPLVGFTGQGFI